MSVNGLLGEMNRMLDRRLTPAVKSIFLINVGVYLLLLLLDALKPGFMQLVWVLMGSSPRRFFFVWQYLTYMFLHDVHPFHDPGA